MKDKQKEIISFSIDHLDPLGQGVSKIGEGVVFVPKTLPNEKGAAEIVKRSRGVSFAQAKSWESTSPLRTHSPCPHFSICGTCHYLHTDYESELHFKSQAMERLTRPINPKSIALTLHPAPRRFAYRERVQLHYNQRELGYHLPRSNQIHPVPECLLPEDSLQKEIKELYREENWKRLRPAHAPKEGHLELRKTGDGVTVAWNQAYAVGGFTQVYDEMNQVLIARVNELIHAKAKSFDSLIDLFGGNGNLSRSINSQHKLVIDIGPEPSELPINTRFLSLDLFDHEAVLEALRDLECDILILDPPRAGIKTLPTIVSSLRPKFIVYISCHCATMVRDISLLQNELKSSYTLEHLELLDLFPTTHHFEALATLKLS